MLCSARDDYVLQQDVCVMCGAFGSDLEGRLISCSQVRVVATLCNVYVNTFFKYGF